ncbi:hypothetical protein FQ377_01865 [Arthrobacter echini]|uniref:Outer membrane channel protein CpnT-like N-terminal domain-containing protein n=1 Tax=Arthrobacter echini TaxID=1529066 RepID=A0A5D0XW53_9MICC|nr:hypothetical protein [Arthrobacter echini]TYD00232.1 hypothetical protein FQ377_01865 [Arthrobacter echini]
MGVLRVDTDRHIEAAILESIAGRRIADAAHLAESSLQHTSGMAGWAAVGAEWAASYDPAASEVLRACHDLALASSDTALALTLAAGRYISAEHVASMGLSRFFTPPTPAAVEEGAGTRIPSAGAPNPGWPPPSWDIIAGIAGVIWPAGDPDLLASAAAAWAALADDIRAAIDGPGAEAAFAVRCLQSEDLALFRERSTVIRESGRLIAQASRDIAAGCEELATAVRTAHQELVDETEGFVLECAALAAVGVALSLVTLGGSAAVTTLVGAARTAQMVARVHGVISRLALLARTRAVATRLSGATRMTAGLRTPACPITSMRSAPGWTRQSAPFAGARASTGRPSRLAPAARVLRPVGSAGLKLLDSRAVSVALSSPASLVRGRLSLPARRMVVGPGAVGGSASDQVFALLRSKGLGSSVLPAAEAAVRTRDRIETARGLVALPGALKDRYGAVVVDAGPVRSPGRLTGVRASPGPGPTIGSSPVRRTSRPAASP